MELGHEDETEHNYPPLRRISNPSTRHSTYEPNGEPKLQKVTPISGLDHDVRVETQSIGSLPDLEQPLTIGGEPNPDAPHTPEPVSESTEYRNELHLSGVPPGVLSWEAICLLAPFGIFGLLARLGINAIATYNNQAVFSLAWVQAAGCFIMGVAQYQKPFMMSL